MLRRRPPGRHQDTVPSSTEVSDTRFQAAIERQYRADDPWQYLPTQPKTHVVPDRAAGGAPARSALLHQPGGALRSLLQVSGILPSEKYRMPAGLRLVVTLVLVAALSTGAVLAASSIFNLGKPTNAVSTNQYFPLSGFHYIKDLQPAGKARVLFIGTLTGRDPGSAVERWPLVKALQQFGAFSRLKAMDRGCYYHPDAKRTICWDPSFDWSHATYRSPYLRFEARELMRNSNAPPSQYNLIPIKPYQRMNRTELALYKRFTHARVDPRQHDDPYSAVYAVMSGKLPLIVIGNYLEQGASQVLHVTDIEEQVPPGGLVPTPIGGGGPSMYYPSGLTFAQVQQALQTQTDPKGSTLVEDVNAEANIVTALICRADGKKPARVCGRSVISSLLRHIR